MAEPPPTRDHRKQLNFHIWKSDKDALIAAARIAGQPLGEYVRDAAMMRVEREREDRIERGLRDVES